MASMAACLSPRHGFCEAWTQPFDYGMNNFPMPDECALFLDYGQGSAQAATTGCNELLHSSYRDDGNDCLHQADFSSLPGVVSFDAHRIGSSDGLGCSTSAEFLNKLGGCEDNTPRVFSDTGCALRHYDSLPESMPESYPCQPALRVSTPESEPLAHTVSDPEPIMEDAQPAYEEAPCEAPVGKKGAKAKGGARRAPAKSTGRKGAVTKARGGRKAAAAAAVVAAAPAAPAPPSILFSGSLGGSGRIQALSLPWSLSLVQLNRQLAGGGPTWLEMHAEEEQDKTTQA